MKAPIRKILIIAAPFLVLALLGWGGWKAHNDLEKINNSSDLIFTMTFFYFYFVLHPKSLKGIPGSIPARKKSVGLAILFAAVLNLGLIVWSVIIYLAQGLNVAGGGVSVVNMLATAFTLLMLLFGLINFLKNKATSDI